ncbi:MAG: hypothetical protein IID18_00990 [Nitrospinae bacterium]|nr:hypothetical protein [Nitrospinota bacterium]
MMTRTLKNRKVTSRPRLLFYNPLKWIDDFEQELLENNRRMLSRIYNTDIEEYWLKEDD